MKIVFFILLCGLFWVFYNKNITKKLKYSEQNKFLRSYLGDYDTHFEVMAKPPQRDIIKIIFQNFFKSFRPKQIRGNLIGEDYFGNKYYEIPADPSSGKRKPSRWFEPADKEAFDQELTAEWEAWLRGRREEPPSREELVRNLQVMEMKKKNAADLDIKYGKKDDKGKLVEKEPETIGTFPKYKEYEIIPGKDPEKKF